MAYARFGAGSSDVYVFMHVAGFLTCCGCSLTDKTQMWGSYDADTTQDMIDHLQAHVDAGHNVPEHIGYALWEDDADNFPEG